MIVYSSTHLITKSVPTLEKGWHSLWYVLINVSNLLQPIHLSLLLLDGLVVDVLIVRHELVDGA